MSPILHSILAFVQTWWVELLCAVLIVLVVPLIAGYIVLVERKVMADMQARLGPTRVGPHGLLQPIADALKLLIKEDLIPDNADQFIFWLAPVLSMTAALTSMGAVAFGPWFQVARDINIGLLFVVGVTALGPFGIVLGGWASNNHYSIIGALRSTAQLISYETTAGFALVSGFLLAGTLNVRAIVETQRTDHAWYVFLAPVGFFTYLIASIAETNRAPFDLPEAESELVAGYMTEYSGFRWSLYFLAEYANMIVVASVGTTLFLGGWLRPFPNIHWLGWLDAAPTLLLAAVGAYCVFRAGKQPARVQSLFMWAVAFACFVVAVIFALASPFSHLPLEKMHDGLYGAFWFLLKDSAYIYIFMWLRFTLPRFRFDQLMRLGWHILIPLALINVVDVGIALALSSEFGLNRWLAMIVTTAATLGAAILLLHWNDKYSAAASAALLADSSVVEDPHAG
ncbi:MAG TPA: complex I subunit 1 family protein [Candidatus Acidoferrum sp.]|jgi:NADH-quinone oxidoreductase subunit H|nr:complex I subunit 1 family protein [Candidatus Acidoferrum sp.]